MKTISLILIALSLVACGDPSDYETRQPTEDEIASIPDDYPWNGEYDIETQSGFLISTDYDLRKIELLIESHWREMQNCTGIYIDPVKPVVIEYNNDMPPGTLGFHYETLNYVHIRVYKHDLTRRDYAWMQTTRHEMINELLRLNDTLNPSSQSEKLPCELYR